MMNPMIRVEILNRLRTIRGHIAGIERMVEEDHGCQDILVQLSAIRSSVEKTGVYLLENNSVDCLCGEGEKGPIDRQKVEQIIKQILTFMK